MYLDDIRMAGLTGMYLCGQHLCGHIWPLTVLRSWDGHSSVHNSSNSGLGK